MACSGPRGSSSRGSHWPAARAIEGNRGTRISPRLHVANLCEWRPAWKPQLATDRSWPSRADFPRFKPRSDVVHRPVLRRNVESHAGVDADGPGNLSSPARRSLAPPLVDTPSRTSVASNPLAGEDEIVMSGLRHFEHPAYFPAAIVACFACAGDDHEPVRTRCGEIPILRQRSPRRSRPCRVAAEVTMPAQTPPATRPRRCMRASICRLSATSPSRCVDPHFLPRNDLLMIA